LSKGSLQIEDLRFNFDMLSPLQPTKELQAKMLADHALMPSKTGYASKASKKYEVVLPSSQPPPPPQYKHEENSKTSRFSLSVDKDTQVQRIGVSADMAYCLGKKQVRLVPGCCVMGWIPKKMFAFYDNLGTLTTRTGKKTQEVSTLQGSILQY
jgi:hypothetical protein